MHRLRTAGPLALAALFYSVLLLTSARAQRIAASGTLLYGADDAYIEMALAKNLATHGVWGVTRFEFSGTSTTLAWPVALASVWRVAGRHAWAGLVLNAACALLLLALADAILRRYGAPPLLRTVALALMTCATSLPVLALTGMEHSFQALSAMAFAYAGVRALTAAPASRARPVAAMLAASVLMLSARFDTGSVLVPVLGMWLYRREWRTALALGVAAAVPVLAYAVFATLHGWPPLPASVLTLNRFTDPVPAGWLTALNVLGVTSTALALHTRAFLVLLLAALVMMALTGRDRPLERECRPLLGVFAGATLVHFYGSRAGEANLFRYEAYLVPLGVVASAAALSVVALRKQWVAWSGPWLATALLSLAAIVPLAQRGIRMQQAVTAGAREMAREIGPVGRFFGARDWDGAIVVRNLLGGAYWMDNARIVDLDGLANEDVTRAILAGTMDRQVTDQLARAHRARYAVTDHPVFDIPDTWIRVADWVDGDEPVVTFFALDRAAAETLAGALARYDPLLPQGVRRIGP